jgi:hypothetical protein
LELVSVSMLTGPGSGDDDGDGNLVLTKAQLSIAG